MTWFCKTGTICATLFLLGLTLEVLGYTLWMCQQDCKDEPDDHVCSRFNFTSDSGKRNNISDYKWLRNDCERKCFNKGSYERVANMSLCVEKGQTQMTYICSDYDHPTDFQKCMRNESMH